MRTDIQTDVREQQQLCRTDIIFRNTLAVPLLHDLGPQLQRHQLKFFKILGYRRQRRIAPLGQFETGTGRHRHQGGQLGLRQLQILTAQCQKIDGIK